MWTPPLNEIAELTRVALLLILYSERESLKWCNQRLLWLSSLLKRTLWRLITCACRALSDSWRWAPTPWPWAGRRSARPPGWRPAAGRAVMRRASRARDGNRPSLLSAPPAGLAPSSRGTTTLKTICLKRVLMPRKAFLIKPALFFLTSKHFWL